MVVGSALHQTGAYIQAECMRVDGNRTYFDGDGVMHTGWAKAGDDWQYFKDDGTRVDMVLSRVTQCTLS